jgi:hypothetical protein
MAGDPRSSGAYRKARALWLAGYGGGAAPCAICHGIVNTSLPGTHPHGPTIEHRVPVRVLGRQAQTMAEFVALVCDSSNFAVAHKRCQDRQGGASSVERHPQRQRPQGFTPSRVW